MRIGRSVKATGRVQGVFFRAWAKEQADELGVAGWVRNCADGSVEVHLAGSEQAIKEMIERLRVGPPQAQVAKVEIEEVEPEGADSFDVRH